MGYGLVMAGELPAGVVHAGSREFLEREGLPRAGAFLDFGLLGDGPLEAVAEGALASEGPFAAAGSMVSEGPLDSEEPFAAAGPLVSEGPLVSADAPESARLFVLGETEYCAPFARSGNAVLLDGVTGEVFLTKPSTDWLERDLLASDLPALAAMVREVESVAEAALRPDALGGRRGPAVVAEVMA
ncbi:hypothetical protein AB0O00_07215, partial [Kitasatospora sp. NPDC093558]